MMKVMIPTMMMKLHSLRETKTKVNILMLVKMTCNRLNFRKKRKKRRNQKFQYLKDLVTISGL
jgi:hypothetical protein